MTTKINFIVKKAFFKDKTLVSGEISHKDNCLKESSSGTHKGLSSLL